MNLLLNIIYWQSGIIIIRRMVFNKICLALLTISATVCAANIQPSASSLVINMTLKCVGEGEYCADFTVGTPPKRHCLVLDTTTEVTFED